LVAKGASKEAKTNNGSQAIHAAAVGACLPIVQWLVTEQGADVNSEATNGTQPLHDAAHTGNQELVEWLVAHGAAVDATTISGKQAIHSASNSGNLNLVQWLVRNGASPRGTSLDGWQRIHVAAYSGRREIVDWLIAQGVALDGQAHCGPLIVKPLDLAVVARQRATATVLAEALGNQADDKRKATFSPFGSSFGSPLLTPTVPSAVSPRMSSTTVWSFRSPRNTSLTFASPPLPPRSTPTDSAILQNRPLNPDRSGPKLPFDRSPPLPPRNTKRLRLSHEGVHAAPPTAMAGGWNSD